jgi:anti-sigma factor RsiW
MNHDDAHELLALRLYGELSTEEDRALERHLATCTECTSFARELAQGLGVLAHSATSADRARLDELPPDWLARLRAATRPAPRRWLQPLATFAAGVAAGLLVMAALRSPASPALSDPTMRAGNTAPFVPRSEPPPRASSRGELARLDTLVRR